MKTRMPRSLLYSILALSAVAVVLLGLNLTRRPREVPVVKTEVRPGPKLGHLVVGMPDDAAGWGGIVANDGLHPGPASRFAAAGLDVELRVIRGAKERLSAFDTGQLDVLLLPLDAYALLPASSKPGARPSVTAFFIAAVGSGQLGIVAAARIRNLDQLLSEHLAATRSGGPAFLSQLLGRLRPGTGLAETASLLSHVEVRSARDVFDAVVHGEVPAAVLPQPLLAQACHPPKLRVLFSTATAGGATPSVLFARAPLVDARTAAFQALVAGWLAGNAELGTSPAATATIGRALGQSADDTSEALGRMRLSTVADNWRYLGPAPTLFDTLVADAQRLGVPAGEGASARTVIALPPRDDAEPSPRRRWDAVPGAPPILSRALLVHFVAGPDRVVDQLTPSAAAELAPIGELAAYFAGAPLRLEVLAEEQVTSLPLSRRRLASVLTFLNAEATLPRARFDASTRELGRPLSPPLEDPQHSQRFELGVLPAN